MQSIFRILNVSVAAIVLAAGRATRMRDHGHKLLADFDGAPLIWRTVEVAAASDASSVTVVTGHQRNEIEKIVAGLGVHVVHNSNFDAGMGSSLALGILQPWVQSAAGVIVLLADMPKVKTEHLNKLIKVFRDKQGKSVVRAVSATAPGHPVILPSSLYGRIALLNGDFGARQIIEASGLSIIDVDIGDAAIHDVDTHEAVEAAGGISQS